MRFLTFRAMLYSCCFFMIISFISDSSGHTPFLMLCICINEFSSTGLNPRIYLLPASTRSFSITIRIVPSSYVFILASLINSSIVTLVHISLPFELYLSAFSHVYPVRFNPTITRSVPMSVL